MAKSINTKNKNYGKKAEIFFYLGLFCFVFAVAMLIGLAAKGTFFEKLNDAGIALSAVVGVFGVLGIILLIVAYIYSVKNKKYLKYLQETKEKEKLNAADSTNKQQENVMKQTTPILQNPVNRINPVSNVMKNQLYQVHVPSTNTRTVIPNKTIVRPIVINNNVAKTINPTEQQMVEARKSQYIPFRNDYLNKKVVSKEITKTN